MSQGDACRNGTTCGDRAPAEGTGEKGKGLTEKCSYRPSAFSIAIMLSLQVHTWHIRTGSSSTCHHAQGTSRCCPLAWPMISQRPAAGLTSAAAGDDRNVACDTTAAPRHRWNSAPHRRGGTHLGALVTAACFTPRASSQSMNSMRPSLGSRPFTSADPPLP